jgi:hypothetical protein
MGMGDASTSIRPFELHHASGGVSQLQLIDAHQSVRHASTETRNPPESEVDPFLDLSLSTAHHVIAYRRRL